MDRLQPKTRKNEYIQVKHAFEEESKAPIRHSNSYLNVILN